MGLKISDRDFPKISVSCPAEIPAAFRQYIREHFADPGDVPPDGEWHIFTTPSDADSKKSGRKAGYCSIRLYELVGIYGSRRPGECDPVTVQFTLPDGAGPTDAERQAQAETARRTKDQQHADAATRAQTVCESASDDLQNHSYLADRGVLNIAQQLKGAVVRRHPSGALVTPMRDGQGLIWNRQAIAADGRKRFLDGGRTHGLGCWVPSKPNPGAAAFVVEGIAKALAVFAATQTATLCAFSANNLAAAIAEHGHGLTLTVAGDNDSGGKAGFVVALQQVPHLRVVYPPDEGDWNDLLVKHGMEALRAALTQSVPGNEWPDPASLPGDLPPVASFKLKLLPETLQPWIADISERMQCPPDFPAIGAMIALAAIVGRKVGIRPKRQDDWVVIPNLWGVIVGRPGMLKSPALHEALKPVYRLDREAADAYQTAMIQAEADREIAEQRKQVNRATMRELMKKSQGSSAEFAALLLADTHTEPVRKRYIVNDSSVEKLGELLNQNSNGLLAFRDELLGLLSALDRVGQEGARQFFLEAWNGNGRFTYDRIGRGTVEISACCLSILGSIQPDPLQTYLLTAPDDGLAQRFQLAVWPDGQKEWRNIDRWPNKAAKEAAWEVYQRLDALVPLTIGATPQDEGDVPCLRYDEPAQLEFDRWRESLELRLRNEDLPPALETVLSKYRSLVPSLALLIHLADYPDGGPVGLEPLFKACAWCEYLESHARRMFSAKLAPNLLSARALAAKIKAGVLRESFSSRTLYQAGWSRLATPEHAQAAVNVLVELDWLRPVVEASNRGRPRTTYAINPKVMEG